MFNVAIIGATGYTGLELLRLLEKHPEVKLVALSSRKEKGKRLEEVFNWAGKYKNLLFEDPGEVLKNSEIDLFFLCLPSGESAKFAKRALSKGKKVIDLSADFRFKELSTFEKTYKLAHPAPELLSRAVYGLSEIYREDIKKTDLVANPGCYPTSVLLPLIPLFKENLIEEPVIIDSKSGTSGAGRKSDNFYSFCEVNEDFKAYKVASHRHNPEIEEKLSQFAGKEIKAVFTPHLLPINRGILSTIYVKFKKDAPSIRNFLQEFYKGAPFVKILPEGKVPTLKEVRNTNLCKIAVFEDKEREFGIIISVIDNLLKGASGQAVQNMNLMFGFPEEIALPVIPNLV